MKPGFYVLSLFVALYLAYVLLAAIIHQELGFLGPTILITAIAILPAHISVLILYHSRKTAFLGEMVKCMCLPSVLMAVMIATICHNPHMWDTKAPFTSINSQLST